MMRTTTFRAPADESLMQLTSTSAKNKKYKAEAEQLRVQVLALQDQLAARDDVLQDSVYDEVQGESLLFGTYDDFVESPRRQKKRRVSCLRFVRVRLLTQADSTTIST